MNKPKFDPSKPFEAAIEEKPKFNPAQAFEAADESIEPSSEQSISGLESAGRGLAKGATLSFADELAGLGEKAGTWLAGQTSNLDPESLKRFEEEQLASAYQRGKQEYSAEEKAAQEANPEMFLAGELGSAALLPMGSVGTAAKLGAGASKLSKFGKLLETGARMAPAAAGYGAAQAIGASEQPLGVKTLEEAAKGAALGGTIGLAAPAALAPVGAGISKLGQGVKALGSATLAGAKKIPGLSDIVIPLELTVGKGVNPKSADEITALQQLASEQISKPAQETAETITKTQLVPEQEALTSLSGELGQQLESGVAAQARSVEQSQVKAAAEFLNRVEGLGQEAGAIVGQLKKDVISASPDAKTDALYNAVKRLEQEIVDNPSMQTDEARQILQNYKNSITIPGAPTEATKVLSRTTGPDLEPVTKELYKVKGKTSPREAEALFESAQGSERRGAELARKGEIETLKTTDVAKLPEQLSKNASPSQYFKILDDMGSLSKSLKGTPIGTALSKARKQAADAGREAFFGPEGQPLREIFDEANKVYSSKLNLQERYGIDFSNPGEAQSKVLSYMNAISSSTKPEASKAAMLQGFLEDLKNVEPKLADEFMQTFTQLKARGEALPQVPKATQIEKAFMESPTSRQALSEVEQVGRSVLPESSLQQTMARGEASALNINKAKEELKNLNTDKLLQTVQNLDNPVNIKANSEFRKFVATVRKVDPAKADALMKEPLKTLETLRDIAFVSAPGESTLGQARSIARTASTEVGLAINRLKDAVPADIERWIASAEAAGKPMVAKYLQQINSEDRVAKNAALFMISQQTGLKQDVESIVDQDNEGP